MKTCSTTEEIICTLWLIAALLATSQNMPYLAAACYIKSAVDAICSIVLARSEIKEEKKLRP
jgi:hypothetical protein